MILSSIPNKRYVDGVRYSDQEYWGVKFNGRDGWEEPDGAEYSNIRESNTGTPAIPGVGGLHTWDEWEAYWTDVSIGSPDVETYTEDIPGRHGLIDLSEVLTGEPVYKNRDLSITLAYPGSGGQWHTEYSDILLELHGRVQQLIFDSDPEYYYEGRCTVSSKRQDNFYATFTINVDADPFKYAVNDSLGDWLWDPFNFETGVILELGSITLNRAAYNDGDWLTYVISDEGMPYDVQATMYWTSRSFPDFETTEESIEAFRFYVETDSGTVLHSSSDAPPLPTWTSSAITFTIPAGTKAIRIGLNDSWYEWDEAMGGYDFSAVLYLYFREKRL